MARDPAMARDRNELFVASFLMLFVELVLIRWAGAYVIYLSYFANFILLGSFLGIGVGFLRARREPDLFRLAPILLVLFVGVVKALPVRIDRTGGDLVYFGVQTHGLPTWVMLPFIFLATAAVMASIAHGVAARFSRLPALDAYRADIIGSICGIAVFSLLALLGAGPIAWGLVVVALFVVLLRRPSVIQVVALAGLLVVFAAGTFRSGTIWSPYYRLEVTHDGDETAIDANGSRIRPRSSRPARTTRTSTSGWRIRPRAYSWWVRGTATTSPSPLSTARHMSTPSRSIRRSRRSACSSTRSTRTRTRGSRGSSPTGAPTSNARMRQYDLIIFALPDSLTLVAGQSAIRLESFLFTLQAFQAAHDRLAPGGSFAIYNFYREQWLADRLAGTMADVFGQRPCLDLGETTAGFGRAAQHLHRQRGRLGARTAPRGGIRPAAQVIAPAVDDRPFPYLKGRTIPSRYLLTVALILLASAIVVRLAGGEFRSMRGYVDLFFMGAAFLLLETKSVVQFALLFGTTWFVNALVFGGVLLSVLIAIEVERRSTVDRRRLLFGLLSIGLLVAWLVPTGSLLGLAPVPRFLAATGLAFFPIFAANLIFASRFRDTADPTAAFGANLLGAMFGGTLEYLSLITGYRALLIVVAILYALAYVTFRVGGTVHGGRGPARRRP